MKLTAPLALESSPLRALARVLALLALCAASVFAAGCCDDGDDDPEPFIQVTPTSFQFGQNFNGESFEETYTWDCSIDFAPIVDIHVSNFWYGDFVLEVTDADGDLLQPRIHLFTGGGWVIIDGEFDDTIQLESGRPGRWLVNVYVNGMDGNLDFLIH